MTRRGNWLFEMSNRMYGWALLLYPVMRNADRQRMRQTFRDLSVDVLSNRGRLALIWETAAESVDILRAGFVRRLRGRGTIDRGLFGSQGFSRNVRGAVRQLWSRHAALVICTLALGIGSSTAVFSVVESVLLSPLPYDRPGELVRVGGVRERRPGLATMSHPLFLELNRNASTLQGLSASSVEYRTLVLEDRPERVRTALVTEDFFSLLAVSPHLGRPLTAVDHTLDQRSVVLSYDTWLTRFGEQGIGTTLRLNGVPYTVVGVLPESFHPPEGNHLRNVDVWIPMAHFEGGLENDLYFLDVIGRIADGTSLNGARQEMSILGPRLAAEYGGRRLFQSIAVEPLLSETVSDVSTTLWMLSGAVLLLFLSACSNVTQLELTRAATRTREFAVRAALGASRRMLLRQVVTESLFRSLVGAAAGVALAIVSLNILTAFHPADIPRLAEVSLNMRALGLALAAALLCGMTLGVIPYLTKLQHAAPSQERTATEGRRAQRTRSVIMTLQSAMAMVLLVGAALLVRSLVRLGQVPDGFDSQNLMRMSVQIDRPFDTQPEQWATFFERVNNSVSGIPGVRTSHLTTGAPFSPGGWITSVNVDGRTNDLDGPDGERVRRHQVSGEHLTALGLAIRNGREITSGDVAGAEPVAVINEALAVRLFGQDDPLGQRITIGGDGTFTPRTIVGVVENARYDRSRPGSAEHVYLPYKQFPAFSMDILARYEPGTADLQEQMRRALWQIQPDLAVQSVTTMRESMRAVLIEPGFYAWLLSSFAAIALLLAAVGIYGTVSVSIEGQKREIGVRMALGARPNSILMSVTLSALFLSGIGLVIGLVAARAGSRILEGRLFEISAADTGTHIAALVLLILVGVVAALSAAVRAIRIDIVRTLLAE